MLSENFQYLVSNSSITISTRFSKCTKNNIIRVQKCKSGLAVLSTGLIHIGMRKQYKVLSLRASKGSNNQASDIVDQPSSDTC